MGKNSSKEKGAAGGSHGFNDELLHDKDSAHIKGYKPVRPRRFVDGVWEYEDELAADQIATVAADLSASPTVSALTFNIWFNQQLRFADRMEAVLAVVEERKPDFVCLQEVIPRFVREHLVDNAFVRDHYSITSVDGETLGGYGVMILARPAALRPCNLVYLNSGMDRQLVAGLYAVGGVELAVGTIHLESLGNPDKRASQLAAVADFLSEAPHALVMGDFNFCSYRNFRVVEGAPLEQEVMANVFGEYTDVWAAVRNTDAEPGYTFDSDVNPNITQDEVMRYDRLCVKSAGDVFAPIAIDLVGNAPIEGVSFMRNIEEAEDHPDNSVWPSDHLGLYAEFEVAIATATDAVASATEAVATTQPRLDDTDDFADEVD